MAGTGELALVMGVAGRLGLRVGSEVVSFLDAGSSWDPSAAFLFLVWGDVVDDRRKLCACSRLNEMQTRASMFI